VLGKSNVRFRVPDYVFMVLKAYGMGIILSTGYIHMFPPANKNLTSKCLPREWNEGFTAYAGLFALMATLSTQLIQTIAINHFKKRRDGKREEEKVPIATNQHHHKDVETDTAESISTDPAHGHPGHHECNHDHHTHAPGGPIAVPEGHRSMESSRTVELGAMTVATNIHSDGCCDVDHVFSASDHDHLKITAVILEAGIALHSLIIGITLGVTSGHEFVSLLIAVAFHQFFEGFALSVTGTRHK
jgi:zinc transporter 1/2/3